MSRHLPYVLMLLCATVANGQSRMERFRSDRSSRDSDRSSRDKDTASREFLSKLDRNQDGQLTRDEIPDFALRSVTRLAEEHKLNLDQPMSIETLSKPAESGREEQREKSSDKKEGSPASPYGAPPPGFDVPTTATPVSSFSVPLANDYVGLENEYDERVRNHMNREVLAKYDKNGDGMLQIGEETKDGRWSPDIAESDLNKDGRVDKAELLERYAKKFNLPRRSKTGSATVTGAPGASSSSSTSAPASTTNQNAEKVREYARGLLNRYDTSKNGMLEKEEWKEMKSEYHAADLNKDNVITLDELAGKLSGYSTSTGTQAPSAAASSSGSSSSSSTGKTPSTARKWWKESATTASKEAPKKSARFLTPTERLPKGLPDWFLRQDASGDGQVAMSEYATSWSDATVAEFAKFDLDGDGIITPEECLAVEKAKKK